MSVRIRLQRRGAKKRPFYRVVATDKRAPRDGRFIELLGTYDPLQEPPVVRLKGDRVQYWLGVGAQPSETARSLIAKLEKGEAIDLSQEGAEREARQARKATKKESILARKQALANEGKAEKSEGKAEKSEKSEAAAKEDSGAEAEAEAEAEKGEDSKAESNDDAKEANTTADTDQEKDEASKA